MQETKICLLEILVGSESCHVKMKSASKG